MRGKPNNGLATCVTWLMVGIAAIVAIEIVSADYEAFEVARNKVPEWTDKSDRDLSHVGIKNQAEKDAFLAKKKAEHEAYRARENSAGVEHWLNSQWAYAVVLMLCGLFAAGGIYLGRVIRGKQPDQGAWRSR